MNRGEPPHCRWSLAAALRFDSPPLDTGPVPRPQAWLQQVNAVQTEAEVEAMRECIRRRRPYGEAGWMEQVAGR